jgi:hypothetical protein
MAAASSGGGRIASPVTMEMQSASFDAPGTPRAKSPRQQQQQQLLRSAPSPRPASPPAAAAAIASSNRAATSYTYLSPNGSVAATSLEGYLLKRGSHLSNYVRWNDRYFILRPERGTLSYYLRRGDVKPRGVVQLGEECTVGEVYMAERRERRSGGSGSAAPTPTAAASQHDGAAVPLADADHHGNEESGGSSERSNGSYSIAAGQYSDSDRDQQVGVSESELTARERQPVTKRLASAVYGSSGTNTSKASGGAAAGGKSSAKTRKGREKLYCIKISWLRAGSGSSVASSSPERRNAPPPTQAEKRRTVDDEIPEIPNIASVASADTMHTASMGTVPLSPRPAPIPSSPVSISAHSVDSDGLRGTEFVREDGGSGAIYSSSSAATASPTSKMPRPPGIGIGRGRSNDSDGGGRQHSGRSTSETVSPTRPPSVSSHRRATSEAVGAAVSASDGTAVSYALPPRNDGPQRGGDLPPRPPSVLATPDAGDLPLLPSVASLDGAENAAAGNAKSGIAKHYQTQVALQKSQTEEEYQKALQLMHLSAKRAAYKKNKKRFVQGSKIAAAAAAVTTASVLTAGVGLAVGLVFVGITAAAGGSGAVAEASYKRSKDSTSLVIAAPTLEEAQAWRDAILAAIAAQGSGAVSRGVGKQSTLPVADPHSLLRSPATSPRNDADADAIGGLSPRSTDSADNQGFGLSISFETQWIPVDTSPSLLGIGGGFSSTGGMRIFREEPLVLSGATRTDRQMYRQRKSMLAVVGSEGHYACLPLKASVVLTASPLDAFMCLMSHSRIENPDQIPLQPNSGQRASFRIIETIDDHCDIIHVVHRPLYLFPTWTAPRDYCLFRYWRFEADGTYMICYDSVEHRECPPTPEYVRGSLYGVQTIAPKRRHRRSGAHGGIEDEECLLTHHVQVDPKGWVPKSSSASSSYFPSSILRSFAGGISSGYVEAFGISALLCSLDVKDALNNDRFVHVSMDTNRQSSQTSWKRGKSFTGLGATIAQDTHDGSALLTSESDDEDEDAFISDYRFVEREEVVGPEDLSVDKSKALSWAIDPPPCATWAWAAPDANSFLTRGKNYLMDRKKYNAGDSVFRLFAVDMVEVDGTIYSGMCAHPKERVQKALKRERQGLPSDLPPYVVAINIAVAGPPWYHMVFYYAVDDKSSVDGTNGTPFSKLANEFFFGDSDEMRDETFKMIPRIVEGNFMVRKAVGSTPAIMGNKLKQHYIRTDRYFELLLDTGSSSVAAGVIRLVLGYSKTVVVDMAFLLEGKDESTLPEKIFGAVRLKHYVFGKEHTRFVEAP